MLHSAKLYTTDGGERSGRSRPREPENIPTARPTHADSMSHFDFPDIREELKRLNKELLTRFTALVANMVQAPSQYERRVEEISLLVNNIHHLLNAVRPSQARSTLEHALTEQAKQKRERLDDLREWTKKATEAMGNAPAGLKEAVEEALAAVRGTGRRHGGVRTKPFGSSKLAASLSVIERASHITSTGRTSGT